MVPQKHTESGVRPNTLTIPELEQSKAAVLNTLASVHSRRSYAFANRQVHSLVLQRAQVDVQSRRSCPVPVTPGRSQSVRLYDQFAPLSYPETGGRVRGERLVDAGTGDWNPAGSGGEAART